MKRITVILALIMIAALAMAGNALAEEAAYAPSKPLHELNIISEDKNFSTRSVSDAYGNKYDGPHFNLCSYGRSNVDGEYITQAATEFYADGQYRYLTGTFFTREKQSDKYTIEFMVYADDVLVYCSEPISRRAKAIDFAVDIGNADVIRIASRSYDYTSSGTNPGIILVNALVTNEYEGELTVGAEIDPDKVPLTDLHVFGTHSEMLTNLRAGKVEDSYGNEYKGIYAELVSYGTPSGKEFDTQAYTEFVAGGEYRYLSGTIFTRAKQNEKYQIEFMVFADDELVYASGMINRKTAPIEFVAEIGECDLIRVMSRSVNYTSSGTNPGIILVNPIVSTIDPRGEWEMNENPE